MLILFLCFISEVKKYFEEGVVISSSAPSHSESLMYEDEHIFRHNTIAVVNGLKHHEICEGDVHLLYLFVLHLMLTYIAAAQIY